MMRFKKASKFDQPIDKILDEMARVQQDSDEYSDLLKRLDKLSELQLREQSNKVTADTVWMVAGNIVGILVIVAYEQKHVMASRGMNFILRPRT